MLSHAASAARHLTFARLALSCRRFEQADERIQLAEALLDKIDHARRPTIAAEVDALRIARASAVRKDLVLVLLQRLERRLIVNPFLYTSDTQARRIYKECRSLATSIEGHVAMLSRSDPDRRSIETGLVSLTDQLVAQARVRAEPAAHGRVRAGHARP